MPCRTSICAHMFGVMPRKKTTDVPLTPELRQLRARMASNESWARTENRSARTRPARDAFESRWERQVDPDGVLDPRERAKRAEFARKAHFDKMTYRSLQARAAKRAAAQ